MKTLYGLLGNRLGHSISPQIHSLFFNLLGIDACYHLFEVRSTELVAALDGLKALGAVGANVTIPYKVSIMEHLDSLSQQAGVIGSVNTVIFRNESAIGDNTDYKGFETMLQRYDIDTANKDVTVLGFGGAAKAVIRYLLDNEAGKIRIVVRDKSKVNLAFPPAAETQVDIIAFSDCCEINGDIIINCTPVGMYPNTGQSPLPADFVSSYHTAVDLIYNPLETAFLQDARQRGCKAVNGLYMLVAQAAAAQELWNGVTIDMSEIEKVYNAVHQILG